ncbi:hypothetical protein MNB_SM-7-515 [hydrothermal vent metagenome]|uniref:STAS domain-containing protein n=1 Tax=hydrothermal vent metagenome TaxID=652676 RepID=A0A1W1C1D7_9ZZZZ
MDTQTNLGTTNITIKVDGHITGIDEVMTLKNIISANMHLETFELDIKDAFVIPSALIGFLVKIVNQENKRVIINASKSELKNLLRDLNLDQIFLIR